ncbi:hypothetical protein GJAV_G00104960 [Gymnothorax javanicus]|nr:hypothetical protein GJAV_G00104960 [Gymnothorax javanicus]
MPRALTEGWICMQYLLFPWLIHQSAATLPNLVLSSKVGQEVTLPCNWTSYIRTSPGPASPYLWWETPLESVFELQGDEQFEGPDYKGRVVVEPQRFEEGDCSLLLKEVRFSDAGHYESFVAVRRRRRFIRSVELNVLDHKDRQTLMAGKQFHLKLYTTHSATVVFQGSDATGNDVIWQREYGENRQGRLTEGERVLILSDLTLEDSGTYKVLDPLGRAVSTVLLKVKPEVIPEQPIPEKKSGERNVEDVREIPSSAIKTCVATLTMSVLLFFSSYSAFFI